MFVLDVNPGNRAITLKKTVCSYIARNVPLKIKRYSKEQCDNLPQANIPDLMTQWSRPKTVPCFCSGGGETGDAKETSELTAELCSLKMKKKARLNKLDNWIMQNMRER